MIVSMPQAESQSVSSMLETLKTKLAEVDRQIATLPGERIRILAAIEAVQKIQDPQGPQEKRESLKGKRLVAGEQTAKVVRAVLRASGPLTLEELVRLLKEKGWKSTGDPWRDLKRAYFAMYNKKAEFRVNRPENTWELIKKTTGRKNKNASS